MVSDVWGSEGKGISEDERISLYLLNNLPGISNRKIYEMFMAAGSFSEAYAMEKEELIRLGVFSGRGESYGFDRRHEQREKLLRDYEELTGRGIRLCTIFDKNYPRKLRRIDDAPLLLYFRGELPDDSSPSAAIIGGRKCTGYGIYAAEYFAKELGKLGVQIVSGMAAGIDSAAQRAAIRSGARCFSVLGSGVSNCYPMESFDIFEELSKGQGGVISEFPPAARPDPWRFVSRNRIIAGLSDIIIVAEAKKKSGTAITVDYALSFGKDVYAVPHRICDTSGEGCNALIKDGAIPACGLSDIRLELDLKTSTEVSIKEEQQDDTAWQTERKAKDIRDINENADIARSEKIVYSCLDFNSRHIEDIAMQAGISLRDTIKALAGLEKKGLVAPVQAAYYRKVF